MESQGSVEHKVTSKRKKVFAVALVVILVASGAAFVWYEYLRYWTIEDVAEAVTGSVAAPSFKESLVNRTVDVKGTVTDMISYNTTLGRLILVELDDFEDLHVVYWDEVDFGIGDKVVSEVSFERSQFNAETHVYSPQLDFPALCTTMGMESVIYAHSHIRDFCWVPSLEDDTVTVRFEWVGDEVPLGECNCSVRAGVFSWAVEYVAILGGDYGVEIEWADSLLSTIDSGGPIDYDDADGDGNLSTGDSLSLSGLDVPDCESGFLCYMLHIGLGPTSDEFGTGLYYLPMYLPVMKEGVLRNLDNARQYVCLDVTDMPDGFRLEVAYTAYPHLWSDTSAILYGDSNCSDTDYADTIRIDPFAEDLGTGSETTWYSGPLSMGDMTWTVNVTDVEGDGVIGVGDYVVLGSSESDVAGALEYLQFYLMYEPTDASLGNNVVLLDSSD